MFWRVMAYIAGGLFLIVFVLPGALAVIAQLIHGYIHPTPSSSFDSLEAEPIDQKKRAKSFGD